MSEGHVVYPATVSGYFNDVATAEAAAAELEQLDLGELDPHFDRVNIFRRTAEQMQGTPNNQSFLGRLFGDRAVADAALPNDAVVMVRGSQERLASLVEPLLKRHGATEIRHYAGWDPEARQQKPGTPPQRPAG
ncbi:MAG TPA: hypothetical protein VER55_13325 [Ardenticatenaceae bacterium]|nr:hypothetical protein [Ardenticatenaceae bacterium]